MTVADTPSSIGLAAKAFRKTLPIEHIVTVESDKISISESYARIHATGGRHD